MNIKASFIILVPNVAILLCESKCFFKGEGLLFVHHSFVSSKFYFSIVFFLIPKVIRSFRLLTEDLGHVLIEFF